MWIPVQRTSVQQAMAQVLAETRPVQRPPARRFDPARYHLAGEKRSRIDRWAESFAALPRPKIPQELETAIDARHFELAFQRLPAHHMGVTVGIEMMLACEPDVSRWPQLLAATLGSGGHPGDELDRLCSILELLRDLGLRVFGSEVPRRDFEDMPARVTVFRGTSMREVQSRKWGLSWTLDSRWALCFATTRPSTAFAARLPRTFGDSPGMLAFATIDREAIVALLRWQSDLEILICPRDIAPHLRWITADEAKRLEIEALRRSCSAASG